MDVANQSAKSSPWSPERRPDGKVEIGVNYWNENSQRMSFGSVSPKRYIELWDGKLLKHLYEGKSKPEHLPTRERVVEFLRKEGTAVAAPPPPPPKSVLKPATSLLRKVSEKSRFSPSEILRVGRVIAEAYRLQRLHAKLLCAFYTALSHEWKVTFSTLAKMIGSDHNEILELRRRYPVTFQLIAEYKKARLLWADGRKSNGLRPLKKHSELWVGDLLLKKLQAIPA